MKVYPYFSIKILMNWLWVIYIDKELTFDTHGK